MGWRLDPEDPFSGSQFGLHVVFTWGTLESAVAHVLPLEILI